MLIEMRPLADIKPYDRNPRLNDAGIDAVAESIQAYGWQQPLVLDEDGVIVVGHTRYKAAMKLGLKEVPVHVARGLTPEQVRAYRIADNQTATLSGWDDAKLIEELAALQQSGFDLELTGFTADELMGYLQPDVTPGLTDPDDIPAPPDKAVTQPGDLWLLGRHRLLCGDSAKAEDVDRLLEGQTVQLVNTDPPYNVAVEPRSSAAVAAGLSSFPGAAGPNGKPGGGKRLKARDRPVANDCLSEEEFGKLLLAWFGNAAGALEPGRGFYVWGGYRNLGRFPQALASCGLYFSQAIVWDKQHPVLGRKDFMSAWELGFYGWKEGAAHQFFGPNNATDLWQVKKVSPQKMEHICEKPVELAVRAIEYSSRPGERVLDLFGGSGSTLIAAEQTGRKACLMELDPLYADVVVARYESFSGKKAERLAA